jgi:hypothetical protein
MLKFSLGKVKIVYWALVVLLFSAFAISRLQAQVNTAVLSGTALDTTGAVIAGAQIEATNVGTGISYAGTTDGAGRYTLPEMPIGTYNVSAQKTGFQKLVQTGIVLTIGAHPVLDFTLKVGHTSEVVEVHGQTSMVETTTAAVGQLVSPAQMEDLPLNGRNFTDLLTLAPGVAQVAPGATGGGASATGYGLEMNYSVSGSRPVGTSYMLDDLESVDASDHGTGTGSIGTSLGMEAIQEFQIMTNTYSAEFGGTGAAINMASKSGTNNLHGSAYEYVRNSALDATNWGDIPGQKPSFTRNQFGGSLGGPVKKDKAFYFANYEGLRSTTGATIRTAVPTSLPDLYAAAGYTGSGTSWTNPNVLNGPMPLLTQELFAEYPLAQTAAQCPNVTHTIYLGGTGPYCWIGDNIQNEDYGLARVDYNFGPKDSAFARYTIEHAYQFIPTIEAGIPGWPEVDHEQNQYVSIEERHVFSPSLLNELHVGFVRLNFLSVGGGLNGTDALHQVAGKQDMDWAPGQGLSNLGPPPSSPGMNATNRFSVGDDVVLTKGAHNLHVGILFTRVQTNGLAEGYSGGWWDFIGLNGIPLFCVGEGGGPPCFDAGGSMQGSPFIGFAGVDPSYTYTTPTGTSYPWTPMRYWRQNWLDPYIQDDWKITKRLTLNLGVRYEFAGNPTAVGEPVFVLPNGFPLTSSESSFVAAQHPFTSNPNMKNIDPRVGLAWDPSGDHKTAILAGFGMFHEPVEARTFASSFTPQNPLFDLTFPSLYCANGTSTPGCTDVYPALPTALMPNYSAGDGITWFGAILNNVNTAPYVMQYNLTVQRQLFPGTVFKVGYVGSTGVHEFSQIDANLPTPFATLSSSAQEALIVAGTYTLPNGAEPTATGAPGTVNNPFVGTHLNPNFAAVDADEAIAHSSYNSLQTSVTRQFSRDLAGNAGYTWSKCLDNGSATTSNEQGEWAVYDAYNPKLDRGPCSYNSPQVFTANAIYSLPFHANRAVSGWQISPIFTRFTGLPMNVQNMLFSYQSNIGGSVEGERPSAVPGCNPMVRKLHTEWWNPECFVEMPFGTIGSAGRDSINNPDYFNMDFSLMKTTKITERMSVQLRAEFFDILNHPNFGVGQQGYLMSTVGTINSTTAGAGAYYSQLSNPAAYEPPNPATGFAGGDICNPPVDGVQNPSAAVVGPCYVPTTAAGSTGSYREIQFAVKLNF